METKSIARVNNVAIQVISENGTKLVPVKPICEALGIDEDAQRRKLKEDDFLSSTTVLSTAVGADGKDREMVCIPYKYVFGWLFTIKEEMDDNFENNKNFHLCYDSFYDLPEKSINN